MKAKDVVMVVLGGALVGGIAYFIWKAKEFVEGFKLPEFTLPEIKLPEFTLPEIKLPEFTLPEIKLPEVITPKPEPTTVVTTLEPKVTPTFYEEIVKETIRKFKETPTVMTYRGGVPTVSYMTEESSALSKQMYAGVELLRRVEIGQVKLEEIKPTPIKLRSGRVVRI